MNDSDILRTMAKVVIEIDAAPVVVGGTVVGVVVGPSVGSVGSVGLVGSVGSVGGIVVGPVVGPSVGSVGIVVGIVVGVGSGF